MNGTQQYLKQEFTGKTLMKLGSFEKQLYHGSNKWTCDLGPLSYETRPDHGKQALVMESRKIDVGFGKRP